MAKQNIKNTSPKEIVVTEGENSVLLYNSTRKYDFQLEFKYNKLYLSIFRRKSSDFHVGTFILSDIEEIKTNNEIHPYLQLVDKDKFIQNFKYNV